MHQLVTNSVKLLSGAGDIVRWERFVFICWVFGAFPHSSYLVVQAGGLTRAVPINETAVELIQQIVLSGAVQA